MIEGLVTKSHKNIIVDSYNDIIEIHPFGDIHWDTEACDRDRFDNDIADMKKSKNALFLGMGDYLDFLAWSDRKKIKNSGLHDESMNRLHAVSMADITAFRRRIEFMKGRFIGMIGGNHDWEFPDGKCGTEKLCESLGCEYLGWLSYIKVRLIKRTSKARSSGITFDIVACHGKAGGKLPGTSINQVEDLHRLFPAANIYIMGHDHQRGGWPMASMFASIDNYDKHGFTIKEKEQWLCRSGSYMKGYTMGQGGYVASKLKRPSNLGKITIRIGIDRHNDPEKGEDYKNCKGRIQVLA